MFNGPTDDDLDASVEMIFFMWRAVGNDPSVLTPQVGAAMRMLIVQNFAQLTPDLQGLFGNGRMTNTAIQAGWNSADSETREQLAMQYVQLLMTLGLIQPAGTAQQGYSGEEGSSLGDLASTLAWNTSTAGNWSSRE